MYETWSDRGARAHSEVHRLRALVEASDLVARIITRAISLEEAAPSLLEEIGRAIVWDAAVLWRVEPLSKRQLTCIGTWQADTTWESATIAKSRKLQLSPSEGLAGCAWSSGQPIWFVLQEEELWFRRSQEAIADGLRSGLAFPMQAGSEVVGVVELFAKEVKTPDRELLKALDELANPIGSIMEHARSEDAQRLLDEASQVLYGSLDYKGNLQQMATLCVPRLADVCAIHCLAEDGLADQVGVAHIGPDALATMREVGGRHRFALEGIFDQVVRGGRAELIEELTDAGEFPSISDPEHRAYVRALGLRSAMLVPLRSRGQSLGMLAFATTGSRKYSRADLTIAEELARRASLAIDNARLFESERTARAQAEAATKAKDEFLAILSHELRTPLQSMLGWTQMLRGRRLDDETAARGLAAIERATRAQAQLIGDLLDVSRIVAGKLALDAQRVDLVRILDGAIESMRANAEAKGIAIERAFELPRAEVSGDPHRLQQIVTNLLSNALKFTGSGGRIDVRLERLGTTARVLLEDTGIGISREFLPHIFERFRQADSTSRRAHGGLGLGLTIVQHLVELHGGTVAASSEGEGKGARFEVQLPLVSIVEGTGMDLAPESVDMRRLPRLDGLRVLVVDDDAETGELVRTLLGACGASVTVFKSAKLALESIAADPPDLLISDVRMPDEDGYAFIRRVRALGAERGGAIPAIALTADASGAARDRALAAGFQHHMAKPVQPLHLAGVIASLSDTPEGDR